MRTTINFNDKPLFHTEKINNVGAKRNLTAELESMESLGTELFPENFFTRRLSPSQCPGKPNFGDMRAMD